MSGIGLVIPLIQARMDSERLPGKVMKQLAGKPMLAWTVDAVKVSGYQPIVVTPIDSVNDPIRQWCKDNNVFVSSWPVPDVRDPLAEFAYACRNYGGYFWVVRITADCPMLQGHHISLFASLLQSTERIYTNRPADMDGYDLEGFSVNLLRRAFLEATGEQREHICPWMYKYRGNDKSTFSVMGNPNHGVMEGKVSVDTQAEFDYVEGLLLAGP